MITLSNFILQPKQPFVKTAFTKNYVKTVRNFFSRTDRGASGEKNAPSPPPFRRKGKNGNAGHEKKGIFYKIAIHPKNISLFHGFVTRIACLDFIFILKYKNMVYYP
jgi:hypothetical protein